MQSWWPDNVVLTGYTYSIGVHHVFVSFSFYCSSMTLDRGANYNLVLIAPPVGKTLGYTYAITGVSVSHHSEYETSTFIIYTYDMSASHAFKIRPMQSGLLTSQEVYCSGWIPFS